MTSAPPPRRPQRGPPAAPSREAPLLSAPATLATPWAGGDDEADVTHEPERWERRAELGAGGMGRVTLVYDRWLGREVALKEAVAVGEREHLRHEAAVTARLEHPNVVPIYDLGHGGDGPWFAMRVVRGRSLATAMAELGQAEGDRELRRAALLRHVLAAAQAVAYAHSRGVVHRDLKADNIMIGAFGETQVIDWGLAVAPGEPAVDGEAPGTARAMSPEQARGEAVDPRTDVWSLGIVLWELVAGRPPFPQTTRSEVLQEVREARVPSLAAAAPDAPRELVALIERALAARPEDRYPDGKALADDLARYLDGRRVEAHTYTSLELLRRLIRAWRVPLITAGLVLVVLGTFLVLAFLRIGAERDRAEANLAVSLLAEARRALASHADGQAEVLAEAALANAGHGAGEDAGGVVGQEARGILLALAGPRPGREALAALPCPATDASGDLVVCGVGERVAVLERGQPVWERALAAQGAVFIDGGAIVLVLDGREARRFDARTGEPVGPSERVIVDHVDRRPDHAYALGWNANYVYRFERDASLIIPGATCIPESVAAATLDRAGSRWAIACRDGTLRLGGDAPVRTLAAGLGARPKGPIASAIAFADAGHLLVGDANGGLVRLPIDDPLRHERMTVSGDMVKRVVVDPSGRRAVVLGDGAAPLVVDLPSWSPLVRLPDRHTYAADIDADGRLVALGKVIERWDLGALEPRTLERSVGITALAISRDESRLAVGDGATLGLVDVATRRELARTEWQDNVIKSAGFDFAGNAFAHGLGAPRIARFDRDGRALADFGRPLQGRARRIVALPGGALMVSTYGKETYLVQPEGPGETLIAEEVIDLAVNRDARRVAALTGARHFLCARDVEAGGRFAPCGADAFARAIAVTDAEVLSLAAEGITAWDGERAATRYAARAGDLVCLAAGPSIVVAGGRDGAIWLWDVGRPEPRAVLRSHTARVDLVALAPSETWLAAGSWDGRVTLLATKPAGPRAPATEAWGLGLAEAFGREPEP